jgi:hypothetical protein
MVPSAGTRNNNSRHNGEGDCNVMLCARAQWAVQLVNWVRNEQTEQMAVLDVGNARCEWWVR